ncbi:helix-turn-helix domain-containing protein [Marinobacterium jannaschii]|uniref:helix-turn-helix domain-containing protein n=1 Tax=Marinobacterium jannaschii TaxID=64970 RepID=UPI00056BB3AC
MILSPMPNTPGEVLRMGRQALNKKQTDIASEINRALRTYQKWENDETHPNTFSDIIAVCKACGVPVQDYITGQPSQAYPTAKENELLDLVTSMQSGDMDCMIRIAKALRDTANANP